MKSLNGISQQIPLQFIISQFQLYAGFVEKCSSGYVGCCPTCREGTSWGKKKRLYLYTDSKSLFCFNCSRSWSAWQWLKEVTKKSKEELLQEITEQWPEWNFNEYRRELILPEQKTEKSFVLPTTLLLPEDTFTITDENTQNYLRHHRKEIWEKAYQYLVKRRLHRATYKPKELYATLDKNTIPFLRNRIIFPFKDIQTQELIYYQGRSFDENFNGVRYWGPRTLKKSLFKVEEIDLTFPYIFLLEGPIDACFIKNGVAMAGSVLTDYQQQILNHFPLHERIWILDNPAKTNPADAKNIVEHMRTLIKNKEKVFIWRNLPYKDLNDWCVTEYLDHIDPDYILNYIV